MRVTQRYDTCGSRPYSCKQMMAFTRYIGSSTFCTGSDHRLLLVKIRFSRKLEKNSCYRPRRNCQPVYDEDILNEILSKREWQIKEDSAENYELLVEGLKSCAEIASVPQTRRCDCISTTTKELLEKKRQLKLGSTAAHLTRLVIDASCKRALQDDLHRYKQTKLLEAAQKRTSLKKCRRDLCEYNTPLSALMNADGIIKTSRNNMESITEKFYTNLFRSTVPVADPEIPTGEKPPTILPSEVRFAIENMKKGTAPGPDNITANFLRAGGHNLHAILVKHMTSYLQRERIPDQWRTSRTVILPKKGD